MALQIQCNKNKFSLLYKIQEKEFHWKIKKICFNYSVRNPKDIKAQELDWD